SRARHGPAPSGSAPRRGYRSGSWPSSRLMMLVSLFRAACRRGAARITPLGTGRRSAVRCTSRPRTLSRIRTSVAHFVLSLDKETGAADHLFAHAHKGSFIMLEPVAQLAGGQGLGDQAFQKAVRMV